MRTYLPGQRVEIDRRDVDSHYGSLRGRIVRMGSVNVPWIEVRLDEEIDLADLAGSTYRTRLVQVDARSILAVLPRSTKPADVEAWLADDFDEPREPSLPF